jgi:hypothetical protein
MRTEIEIVRLIRDNEPCPSPAQITMEVQRRCEEMGVKLVRIIRDIWHPQPWYATRSLIATSGAPLPDDPYFTNYAVVLGRKINLRVEYEA